MHDLMLNILILVTDQIVFVACCVQWCSLIKELVYMHELRRELLLPVKWIYEIVTLRVAIM